MRQVAFSLMASVLTAAYWWIVFIITYADVLFHGDRNPALPPASEKSVLVHNLVTILLGIAVYAILVLLWRRMTVSGRS